jgi:tetratricopeptide (TPR) repeat protein
MNDLMRRGWVGTLAVTLVLLWPGSVDAESGGTARDLFEADRFEAAADAARSGLARAAGAPVLETAGLWHVLADSLNAVGAFESALGAYLRASVAGADGRLTATVEAARLERLLGDEAGSRRRLEQVLAVHRASADRLNAAELVAVGRAAHLLAPAEPALYSRALDIYEAAIERSPGDPVARVALGDLLLDRYNNTEAVEVYREALALQPDYPPALLGLARSHHFDHSRDAIDAATRSVKVAPRSVDARVLAARLLVELEDYDRAQREIAAALAVNPRSPRALAVAAAIHYLQGADLRSQALLERIAEIAPGYHEVYVTLAEIAAQNRRYRDAVTFSLGAVARQPNAWRAHALLGMNRMRLGSMRIGRRSLEVAFRGDPFDLWTKNTLDLLDRLDDYVTVESERFVLVAERNEAALLAPMLLGIAERAYDALAERYYPPPPTPIRIEVYPHHEDFSVRTVGLVGLDLLGVSFGPVVILDSPSARQAGSFNLGSVLWHELAHTFHLHLTRSRVPRWFTEGLSVREEHRAQPGWGADVSIGFLRALQQGRLPAASALNDAFLRPSYPDQMLHAYVQGALLMEWIERRHGFDAISALLTGYRLGVATADLIPQVLGMTTERLDTDFEAFLRQRYAPVLAAIGPENGSGPGDYLERVGAGRDALEQGDLQRAETLLLEAQSLFPGHTGAESPTRLLATLYTERQEPERAIQQLERTIAIDADDLSAHRELLALYGETGQADAAVRVLEQALLIQPFDRSLYQELARMRAGAGDWGDAARAWGAVVRLDPADPVGAGYRYADALYRAGRSQAARSQVLAVLETAPMYLDALDLLLRIRERLGNEATEEPPVNPVPGEGRTRGG